MNVGNVGGITGVRSSYPDCYGCLHLKNKSQDMGPKAVPFFFCDNLKANKRHKVLKARKCNGQTLETKPVEEPKNDKVD